MMQNIEEEHKVFLKDIQNQEQITRDFCIQIISLYISDSSLAGEWQSMDIQELIMITVEVLKQVGVQTIETTDEWKEINGLLQNILLQICKNFDVVSEVL